MCICGAWNCIPAYYLVIFLVGTVSAVLPLDFPIASLYVEGIKQKLQPVQVSVNVD
jgi:hypothetical protein